MPDDNLYERRRCQSVANGGGGGLRPTPQPDWELIAQLGDVNPLDYGGYFVYRDRNGNYPEVAEYLDVDGDYVEEATYTVYRFILERCMYLNGVLSDNPYHTDHAVWFADGITRENAADFCSPDPVVRAHAYREIAEVWGWHGFDHYPLELTRQEAEERYGPDG